MAGKYKGEEYVQNYESVPVQLFSTFTSIEFQHKLWQKITQTFEPQLTWITTDLTIELKWISIDLWKYCWIFFPFRAVGDSINSVHKMCTNTDYRNGESVKNNTNTNNTTPTLTTEMVSYIPFIKVCQKNGHRVFDIFPAECI